MNIITGEIVYDTGRVEWTSGVHYGYLDQHTVLTPGKTIRAAYQCVRKAKGIH